ncbi:MAG: 30S ribosomal protein S6 [Firmicutes bacterium]|nr:30S ribosomal protein S6 [Candidatus Fiminaster equi]
MKKYELMYIVKDGLDEAARKAEIEKLHGILTSNGAKLGDVKEWGLRDFAYPINKQTKGYYVVLKLTADEAALNEFSRLAKIDQNVVRHLFTVDND